jgi:hypothetical protein
MGTEMNRYFSVLLLFPFTTAALAAIPLKTDVSVGYTYDDNVTRADLDSDIESDSILSIDASAAYKLPFNEISYFSLKGSLAVNQYLDFTKLSNTRLGIHGSYHLRPSSGYTAARYFARLTFESRMYDSDQRDGSATEIELGLGKRLTDLVSLRAGYIKEDVDADHIVFEAENDRLYVDVDFRTSRENTVYVTLGYLDGDLVTTAPVRPQLQAEYTYWVVDDAFTDLNPQRWAYRLTGSAMSLRLGDNFSLGSNQAIDGSIFYYDAESDGSSSYTGLIYNVNYLYRF